MNDVETEFAIRVPFNRPSFEGGELAYVAQAVSGGHISGDGPFTSRCERLLEAELGAARVLLTTSCTHALELSALLLDFAPGDEVILPSYTFVSTANAFVLRGARPVFVDVRPDTLNIDESLVEAAITPRTRAIVVVHYGGVGCQMDDVCAVAARRGIAVVEDNAHGLFGRFQGRELGSFGLLSTLSFHETKSFTCGEGGALVVNHPDLGERAEILREKGTDRKKFLRGQVDKYTWVDLGSSYVPSDVLAAFLLAQLESRADILARRRSVWRRYHAELREWADANGVRQPGVPGDRDQAYHLYYLLLPTPEARSRFLLHLRRQGILGVFHYVPLHRSVMGERFGGYAGQCPVTEDVAERLVRLPFYNSLSEAEQGAVIDAVTTFAP